MHIMEGFLPARQCLLWGVVVSPFIVHGAINLRKELKQNPDNRLKIAAVAAFIFVLSSLKIPSVTGSCSHPTGTGLGVLLFKPTLVTILGVITLIFQALLLAHGGLTTLGANILSMAVVGPFVSYFLYHGGRKMGIPLQGCVFISATLGDLATYVTTSLELAYAYPVAGSAHGYLLAIGRFGGIFAVTQIPLAIIEGCLTVLIVKGLIHRGIYPTAVTRARIGS